MSHHYVRFDVCRTTFGVEHMLVIIGPNNAATRSFAKHRFDRGLRVCILVTSNSPDLARPRQQNTEFTIGKSVTSIRAAQSDFVPYDFVPTFANSSVVFVSFLPMCSKQLVWGGMSRRLNISGEESTSISDVNAYPKTSRKGSVFTILFFNLKT